MRSKERIKKTAEIFTPKFLVNEILDRLSLESNNIVWDEDKTFCDPACGEGAFLIEILKRKLEKGHDPIRALSTIYGVDIMADNVAICRLKLLEIMPGDKEQYKIILEKNIVCADALTYDFEFK